MHARIGVATGRSSDSQAWPLNKMASLLTHLPGSEKTSGVWVFVPAYRCGAVPDLHRIPFRRFPRNVTSKRYTR